MYGWIHICISRERERERRGDEETRTEREALTQAERERREAHTEKQDSRSVMKILEQKAKRDFSWFASPHRSE
jgi:hypothetical protein